MCKKVIILTVHNIIITHIILAQCQATTTVKKQRKHQKNCKTPIPFNFKLHICSYSHKFYMSTASITVLNIHRSGLCQHLQMHADIFASSFTGLIVTIDIFFSKNKVSTPTSFISIFSSIFPLHKHVHPRCLKYYSETDSSSQSWRFGVNVCFRHWIFILDFRRQ